MVKLVPGPDEVDLASMLRALLARDCPTTLVRSLRHDEGERFPKELWRTLAGVGALGLPFSEKYGGQGGTLEDLGILAVEAGRALCPTVVASSTGFGAVLDLLGTPAQCDRYLPALCAGDLRATVAVHDPADAGDRRPRLAAARADDGGWVLSGTLTFVSDADLADLLLVTAHESPASSALALLVDPAASGVETTPVATLGGDRLGTVVLDDVRVDAAHTLGSPDPEALARSANILSTLRCLEMVGGAEEVLRRTVEHTTGRHQFNRPIASFQAAQHIVADMHIALQAARLSSLSALSRLARGRTATREAAVARIQSTAAYTRITLDAHQLHGGMGYVLDTDLHLWSERARQLATLDGTGDVATGWLAKEIGLV